MQKKIFRLKYLGILLAKKMHQNSQDPKFCPGYSVTKYSLTSFATNTPKISTCIKETSLSKYYKNTHTNNR